MRRYCDINGISVRYVIKEDHSAKTFNRPEWKKYLVELRRQKGKTHCVLFLKWDRFSRNARDACQMINTLRKLSVEPQAIEQPLDLAIPENKMMLAFYLAAPEVENDRRALNVIHGMRRARKEGWYMALAPIAARSSWRSTKKESQFIKGTHEPIISEALYYQVQEVLGGRKRSAYRPKIVTTETLPLRGFLICPKCGKLLTGSKSKGHTKYYTYYHCTTGCTRRFNAETVNREFIYELKKMVPRPEVEIGCRIALTEAWRKPAGRMIGSNY